MWKWEKKIDNENKYAIKTDQLLKRNLDTPSFAKTFGTPLGDYEHAQKKHPRRDKGV